MMVPITKQDSILSVVVLYVLRMAGLLQTIFDHMRMLILGVTYRESNNNLPVEHNDER